MSKINFTKEHQDKLNSLAGEALVKGTIFKAHLGTEMTIYDLFHNTAIGTLQAYNKKLKKEIDDSESDDWTNTESQDRKVSALKKTQELIFLIIGYRKSEDERTAARAKATKLRSELNELVEANRTPADRLALKQKELEELEASLN